VQNCYSNLENFKPCFQRRNSDQKLFIWLLFSKFAGGLTSGYSACLFWISVHEQSWWKYNVNWGMCLLKQMCHYLQLAWLGVLPMPQHFDTRFCVMDFCRIHSDWLARAESFQYVSRKTWDTHFISKVTQEMKLKCTLTFWIRSSLILYLPSLQHMTSVLVSNDDIVVGCSATDC